MADGVAGRVSTQVQNSRDRHNAKSVLFKNTNPKHITEPTNPKPDTFKTRRGTNRNTMMNITMMQQRPNGD